MDIASKAILSLAFATPTRSPEYYHVENPEVTPWSEIAKIAADWRDLKLQLIPMRDWLDEVVKRSKDSDAADIPASILLEFLTEQPTMPPLRIDRTRSLFPMVDFGPIPKLLIQQYLRYLAHLEDA